ncbi:MAG: VanZ family protein [Flexistipes sinusarabici]|uniref:VanZ family protein n=1 Tax=Flexistipes sinusarabici TaxID=2352 RepID=A0A5D0MI33_FLESI|nr:VanZ family protein [Flexistipes sinusarabici]TYB33374.1 MAG: VanZ family protein [Flexistipes sinusarabici]
MKRIYQIIFLSAVLAIEYLSITTREIEAVSHSWDKLNHALAFIVLYVLFSLAFTKLSVKVKIILLLIYALQIEVIQYFIPRREFSLLDIGSDMFGIILGYILIKLFAREMDLTQSN